VAGNTGEEEHAEERVYGIQNKREEQVRMKRLPEKKYTRPQRIYQPRQLTECVNWSSREAWIIHVCKAAGKTDHHIAVCRVNSL